MCFFWFLCVCVFFWWGGYTKTKKKPPMKSGSNRAWVNLAEVAADTGVCKHSGDSLMFSPFSMDSKSTR